MWADCMSAVLCLRVTGPGLALVAPCIDDLVINVYIPLRYCCESHHRISSPRAVCEDSVDSEERQSASGDAPS
ncbi:hypothetical protein V8D89_008379 [Ganoderma adspersum]